MTRQVKVLVSLGLCLWAAASPGASEPISPDSLTIAYSQNLWPKVNGVANVYYVIDTNSDPNATANIQKAVDTFNADFPKVIQWVPWNSSTGANYVDINLTASNTTGVCEANEGYEAIPAQPMTGSTSCTIGTLLHEMGHIIGLWHEQSRSDRATYITVNYGNVIKGSWSNFEVLSDDQQVLEPYDYASVMQYIPYAFSRNGEAVIESIPAGIPLAGYEGVPAQAGASGAPALPAFDYSAGDKESILRLYGAAPSAITVTSNPVGLSVIVDGVTVTTPQTYHWALYSNHTLNVSSTVQTLSGYVLNSNPAVAATFYYTYGRWNNSKSQEQAITVAPGGGGSVFPTTSPQVATYSANFIELVPYSSAPSPAGSGTATISPQPQTYSGVTGVFLVARQKATLNATAKSGWNFYSFNNSPFWLPGGLGLNPKSFAVPDTGNAVSTTAYFSNTPVYTIGVTPESYSSNLYLYVDSNFWYSPKNFSAYYDSTWTVGSTHTLSIPAAEYPYSSNSRYNFASWSDGGAMSHTSAAVPNTSTAYTATVMPEFQPASNFGYPPCGGTAAITPASPTSDGFYPSGQVLGFTATPTANWTFAGWTYDLTGTTNPASLTATGETLVFASFNTIATPLTLTSLNPSETAVGGDAFTLKLLGTGFTAQSLVSVNGTYRTVTYKNSTELKVSLTAADIASTGAFQVYVENFPTGWSGCAVFGYQTFQVVGKGAILPKPQFAPKAGTYSAQQSVTMSDALGTATIYYTTNGTTPTTASAVYTGPITISNTETLKAFAAATGYQPSSVTGATFTIQ